MCGIEFIVKETCDLNSPTNFFYRAVSLQCVEEHTKKIRPVCVIIGRRDSLNDLLCELPYLVLRPCMANWLHVASCFLLLVVLAPLIVGISHRMSNEENYALMLDTGATAAQRAKLPPLNPDSCFSCDWEDRGGPCWNLCWFKKKPNFLLLDTVFNILFLQGVL